MSSLFSEATIEKIKNTRKMFLWTAVCILIGEVVVGAILILMQSFDAVIGKLMATFALCALVLFIGVNNFSLMEKDGKVVQGFALASLVTNLIWLVLSILFIWEILPFLEMKVDTRYTSYIYSLTAMGKLMAVCINAAFMCFLISNVWAIKETVKPVRPLKITALVCELYCGFYVIYVILSESSVSISDDMRWYSLAGLAWFAFIVTSIAAAIISRASRKKMEKVGAAGNVNSADNTEMQAKIQEMVEKEVQERMAAEKAKAEREAMPPLQSDEMPPSVTRDSEIKVEETTIQEKVVEPKPEEEHFQE